jgi:hypothetical protein
MKARNLKIGYYLAFSLCFIQLLFFLIAPFGGPLLIVDTIRDGLFAGGRQEYISVISKRFGISVYNINILNQLVALVYFSSIILGSLTSVFYKMKMKSKFRISLYCFLISLAILLMGKFLNQFY